MDLSVLSLGELAEIKASIDDAIAERKAIEAAKVKAELTKMAATAGFTLADIFGETRNSKRPVSAKYRDPKTDKTWSGRGRAPRWMPRRKSDYDNYAVR
jgi:DNA-binding protein H-NS